MNEIEKANYSNLKTALSHELNLAAGKFFNIGYLLRQINDGALYMADGYGSIWEFAEAEYKLSKATTSRFMAINERFGIDGGEKMNPKYKGMGPSKLQEMLTLPDFALDAVTEDMSVKEIRELKKEAAGQQTAIPGAMQMSQAAGCQTGTEKAFCVECGLPCGRRKVLRECVSLRKEAGVNCDRTTEEGGQELVAGNYKDVCPIILRSPGACCETCDRPTCTARCKTARDMDAEKRKQEVKERHAIAEARRKEEEERREAERQREQQRHMVTTEELEGFYLYNRYEERDPKELEEYELKKDNRSRYFSGSDRFPQFEGDNGWIRINDSRKIPYSLLSQYMKKIRESGKFRTDKPNTERTPEETIEQGGAIQEAEFRELEAGTPEEFNGMPKPEEEKKQTPDPEKIAEDVEGLLGVEITPLDVMAVMRDELEELSLDKRLLEESKDLQEGTMRAMAGDLVRVKALLAYYDILQQKALQSDF